MDSTEFREFGKAAVDFIADYFDGIRNRSVLHSVQPGYLDQLIPEQAPRTGEKWQDVLKDMNRVIMPGITHWHNPHFHAYFAAANSFPAVVGEMMGSAISSIGLNWMASPAYTELEVAMMNWLGKMLGLPEVFLNCAEGHGGGVLQGSASETTLLCLLTARERKLEQLQQLHPDISLTDIRGKLVAYSSDQSNSSIERAGLLGSMIMRLLPSDDQGRLPAATLREAMRKDRAQGLIPCYVVACIGTTPTCAFDDLTELGPVCNEAEVWLHIDAAYAGAAFVCPEYRYLMAGLEYADSFNFNPHKWMLVNYDCSAMWLKDARPMVNSFNVDRVYLKVNKLPSMPEYRHWQIPLGRRFKALKLWFVLRIYGVKGIQSYIRKHVALAKYFEKLVRTDTRFEVVASNMGLVCFRFKNDDLTQQLLDKIVERRNLYLIAGQLNGKKNIRFCICSRYTEKQDVDFGWREILVSAEAVLSTSHKRKFQEFLDDIIYKKNKKYAIKTL